MKIVAMRLVFGLDDLKTSRCIARLVLRESLHWDSADPTI
jgi:hypothetical protein